MKEKDKVTLHKLNVGVFELRFSKAKLEIENNDKSWKMVFASHILPYKTFAALATKEQNEAIETLCTGLYGTISMCANPKVLLKFMEILKSESNK